MSSSINDETHDVSQVWPIPRINLRKRPCASIKMTNLDSVNSAFLLGLFADVAKASVPNSDEISQNRAKKLRMGKSKSISRCERSLADLMRARNDSSESYPSTESCANANTAIFNHAATSDTSSIRRDSSLQYQLDCVTTSIPSTATSKSADISSATAVVFPNLPATVSNSSYGNNMNTINHPASSPITTLTHVISDLQSSNTEKPSQILANDTYGWFVEMEDESSATYSIFTPTSSLPLVNPYFAPKDLAFTAQVAPKADNYDAELEWATAADTVDDVLGCFF